MISRVSIFIFMTFCLLSCESDKNPVNQYDVTKTGKIIVNLMWPESKADKKTDILRDIPDKITVFLYRAGEEITFKNLTHEGSRGTAELIVAALDGYRIEIVAFSDDSFNQVLYTGFKDNITVSPNIETMVDITMVDAAPVLYPATKTGDYSYTLLWSKVPLAVYYMVEESTSQNFISGEFLDDIKLSSTVYSGPDTTKVFIEKASGTYYYCVFAVTPYGDSYSASEKGEESWDFYISVNYGAISNIISVQSG